MLIQACSGNIGLQHKEVLRCIHTSAAAASHTMCWPFLVLAVRQLGLSKLQVAVGGIPFVQQAVNGLHVHLGLSTMHDSCGSSAASIPGSEDWEYQ